MYLDKNNMFGNNNLNVPFKKKYTEEMRKEEAKRLQEKYPDRIRIICEKHNNWKNDNIPMIDKTKYLVPQELTMSQFTYVIRKRLRVSSNINIFLMIKGRMMPSSDMMSVIFNKYAEKDGFLYITYHSENTFG